MLALFFFYILFFVHVRVCANFNDVETMRVCQSACLMIVSLVQTAGRA